MSDSSEDTIVFAIDIGNTRAHLGIIDIQNLQCIATRSFPITVFREQLVSNVIDLFEKNEKTFCSRIVVASVIRSLLEIARSKLEELFPQQVVIAKYTPELPFRCNYRKPQLLGVDRIADILYGYHAYVNTNLITVDTGTAIKIELLHNKEFAGGTILPGLGTQLESLKHSTDALPLVTFEEQERDIPIPGLTTEECISSGVVYGIAGAIERIVAELRETSPDAIVLASGGDWKIIAPYVTIKNLTHVPDMTLIGTALFLKYTKENGRL